MLFSSLEFVFIFLPLLLIIYYLVPNKFKNTILLIFSIIFYSIGVKEYPIYILLIFFSTILNYFLGLLINKRFKKIFLLLGIFYNFGLLFLFKYFNFFTTTLSDIGVFKPFLISVALPLGISFYTFQMVSYLADIYNKKYESEKSILKFSTYSLMFTKMVSGPITSYDEVKDELYDKKITKESIVSGIKLFVIGLGFKVIIANRVGALWSEVCAIGFDSVSSVTIFLSLIAYSLQLYFDFEGYSLMAIGISKLLGFNLPKNFDYPYMSTSMTEFWRRWHITLGTWFKKYIYFPLGGSRKGTLFTFRNMLIVWLFTGLWHGANYNFIIWGLSLFIILVIEKVFLKKYLDKYKFFGHIYMILLIPLTWSVFALSDLSNLNLLFNKIIHFTTKGLVEYDYIKYLNKYWILLILGILFSTKVPYTIYKKNKFKILELIVLLMIFWISIYYICTQSSDPFMYFSF